MGIARCKRTTDWWEQSFERRKAEREATMSLLRCTVFGSFYPDSEKQMLKDLGEYLRGKKFTDTDIIGGPIRPHPADYDSFQISVFYLEESDVNLLVYTLTGKRLGVTTECDHVLMSPQMIAKWNNCVIFNQIDGKGRESIGQLQRDRLKEINSGRERIAVVPWRFMDDLKETAYLQLINAHKAMGTMLQQRSRGM